MRSPRAFDPLRLDVEAFAEQGASLGGCWPLACMSRLAQSCDSQALPDAGEQVAWSAQGERRARLGARDETWLVLRLDTAVRLECQRCLKPVTVPLTFERALRFVGDEAKAEALDMDSDDDVLASSRSLDLRALAEDELLLALPLVPRHEVCPQPLPLAAAAPHQAVESGGRPFEVLRDLVPPRGRH